MRFEFVTATRIIFGAGTLAEIGSLAADMGRHALVVTGTNPERAAPLLAHLEAQPITATTFTVPTEPTVELVLAGVEQARAAGCDLVIGLGGGSVLDAGKAIAALLANPGDPLDYLEVVGKGQPLAHAPVPYIAIPTTAGTGAEVTRNAVLAVPDHQVKVSLRSPLMLPRLALVDPELTYSLPPAITATTGMDALTQCIEPYVSNQANPLTDAVCREGIQRAARSLRRAYDDGADTAARADLALASLFGGLALANAKLGAVHGFAGPLGGMYAAPHGAICARLLPLVTAANIAALNMSDPENPVLARYDAVAQWLTGDPAATAADGVNWLRELVADLRIPGLGDYGVRAADFPIITEKAQRASSMQGNPIRLTPPQLSAILDEAL
jgi:alcohol dehydrogenase class IV